MKGIRLCIGLLLVTAIAMGQQRQVNRIKKELNKVVNSKEFSTAFIGFSLVDTETGKVLVEHNAEKSFTTASTMKLVTTGAALALLGDTFRFKTELGYVGEIKNGVLTGNLVVLGGCDPTLSSTRFGSTNIDSVFQVYIQSCINLGIKKINGSVVSYDSLFSDYSNVPPDYTIGDLPEKYGVPPFSINYRENYFEGLDTLPDTNDSMVVVAVKYTPYAGIAHNLIPPNKIFIEQFDKYLKSSGIMVSAPPIQYYYLNNYSEKSGFSLAKNIITYQSPQLLDIATKTNESSINLYAEGILRAMGINKYGATSLDTCLAIAQRFWKNEVGDLKGLRMTDGSGLSRSNLCSPALMTKMLSSYTNRPNFGSFYSTLAVAGKTGTVANFCKGTAVDGNARIKSGSMSRVKCYAGYVTGKDGKLYAFTLMFNNFESTAAPTAAAQKIIPLIAGLKHGKSKRYLIDLTPSRQ